jgi:hypothetical protein
MRVFQTRDRGSTPRTRTTELMLKVLFVWYDYLMQYSQKYTLVSFLEPLEIDTEFTMANWPLHVTLADVFAVELDTGIEQKLTDLLANQLSISLLAGDDATLGTTNVVLIDKNDKLQKLHDRIIDLLESNGAKFNTPEFTRTGFLPHSTIQKSGKLNYGDKIEIHTISLVDMFPGENWQQRKVLSNFKLSNVNPDSV